MAVTSNQSASDIRGEEQLERDTMKKILLGTIGVMALGIASPASAADLAARPYTKAPPIMAAYYDWSGFYIGLNGGGGSSRKCWDVTNNLGVVIAPAAPEGCHDATGGTVGGQIGYRWQAASWVFGLEAQGNWADFRGSNTNLFFPTLSDHSKINAFGLFTGQVGYAWNNVLLYVKGGAAVVDDRYSTVDIATGLIADRASETRWGGVVGVGGEFAFTPNWSIGVEYDHLFMGTKDVNAVGVGNFGVAPGAFSATDRIHQDVDMVTARINYRWGGPVVARY
jgi:outer membrane immunogenic protein